MNKNLFSKLLKGLCVTALLSGPISSLEAQTAASYEFIPISSVPYSELTGGTMLNGIMSYNSSSAMISIGFPFTFCGTSYNQFKVNSNGWLSFGNVFPNNTQMSQNSTGNLGSITPAVMPLWDEQAGWDGLAYYQVTGSTPTRTLTIEYRNWDWYYWMYPQTISYQIKLHETSNVIEYLYRQEQGVLDGFSESATIGIANNATDYQVLNNPSTNPVTSSSVFYNTIASKPATGQVYRFTPPTNCTGTPTPGTALVSTNTFSCEGTANLWLQNTMLGYGLQYQWEYSTDGINWFNLGTASNIEYASTGIVNQTTQFRCVVTCTSSSQSATSTPVTVTVGAPIAGNALATPSMVCNGGSAVLSTVNGTTTGVSYQWQSSTNNITFTNIPGGTNATYTTPGLTTPMYYRAIITCVVGGATVTTGSTMVSILPTTAPAVNPASLTVACGNPAVLSATPVSGGTIAWFTVPTGGTSVAIGNTVSLYPSTNTTYYAENSLPDVVTSLAPTAVIQDHFGVTGFDYGGIAASSNYIYYTGGSNTGRFNKSDLSGGTSLNWREGFFGDRATGQLWQLGNAFTFGGSFSGFDNVDRLFELDENLTTTGTVLTLSQSIYLNWQCFIATGDGYVLIYDGFSSTYRIDLITGTVTTLSSMTFTNFYLTNSWTSYGWAEFDGADYQIVFREDLPSHTISKYNVTTTAVTPLHVYTNLSNMATIVYDAATSRMYFHHTGASEFGGLNETVGYLDVTTNPSCNNNSRTPVQVTVTPGAAPTISPSGTVNICSSSSQTLTASAGVSFQWYLNGNPIPGATNQTYSASAAGSYTVALTTNLGCTGTSAATTITVSQAQVPAVSVSLTPNDTICVGTIVTFTATPTNGGTNPSYQWKKNGINVGINNAVYTGAGLVNGDQIQVIMTVGTGACVTTNTASSTTITMTVSTNTIPAVTIAANTGTNACTDDAVIFTATPTNGGTTPAYQWKVNGSNVGTNNAVYTAPVGSLSTGDVVSVVMTPSLPCSQPATASANITMNINPLTMPTVSIAPDQTTICQGSPVTMTATDNAPGGTYQWYINGNPAGPNNAVFTYLPTFNDVVTLDFTPPAAGCYDNITISSNSVPLTVLAGLPTMATVSSTGAATQGTWVTVYANLFNFNTNYSIDWYVNSNLYTTTTVPYMSYIKATGQDVIYAIVSNGGTGCYLSSTTNSITIEGWATSVNNTVVQGAVEVYPNPFSKELMIKGLADGDHVILMNMLGQTVQEWRLDKVSAEQQIITNDMAAGSYLLNIRDKDGNFKDMKKLQKM